MLLAATPLCGSTQTGAPGREMLTFTLERSGAAAEHYLVQLEAATGKGLYRVLPAGTVSGSAAAVAGSAGFGGGGGAADGALPISVSAGTLAQVFAAVPLVRSGRCESHHKGIAQTGTKTLRLQGDGVVAECVYNYAEDDRVNTATSVFEALALTMEFGDRLRSKLRFDRLGLDAEMDGLEAALASGRALEIANIAPALRAVADDDRVMERVRRKAVHLLEGAGGSPGPSD